MLAGNLFTRDYLLEGIARTDQWKALKDKDFQTAKSRLLTLFDTFSKNKNPNEAETERDLIYPVLEALGWTEITVQPNLSTKGRQQVPDALLLIDSDAKAKAVAEKDRWKSFQFGLSIVEAKRWQASLDRSPRRDQGVPATQMLQYLSRVDIQTSGKVRLGILTNGQIWRLYFQGALSVAEDFFEIDLAKALELPDHELDLLDTIDPRMTPEHCLRLFMLMFGREAFLTIDGQRTFHDISRETGKVWEERVTKDLSKLVFGDLFPQFVTAIADCDKNRPAEINRTYLDDVRQSALILLYRLLFVVYAEDRDLLPDNQEPYKDYSLTAMRLEIAVRKAQSKTFSSSSAFYWTKLKTIFKAIADGDNDFGIPPYNGGLFAAENAALLDELDLPDTVITEIIYGLSHRVEEGEARYINYRDLTVQQLGTVYERTLEYDLKVDEDGKVVVDADDTARHESGSYYTPDSLVMLIIEKAVGPLVENFMDAFRARSEELSHERRPQKDRLWDLKEQDPAREILRLKICDPAMGSGHFLVSLVDWMADKVIKAMGEAEQIVSWSEEPYISPLADEIVKVRDEIAQQARQNGWPYVHEHLEDRHIIRRMVLKRCVYGVDKNPLAVELAKVALWLHTFTVGAPLSFLDHHLRCGDSLFGSWVRPAMDRLDDFGSPLLMDAPRKKALGSARAMQTIERLTDVDVAEVYQSKELFDGIEEMTSELTDLLTLIQAIEWHAPTSKLDKAVAQALVKGTFGDPIKLAKGELELKIPARPKETDLEKKKREQENGKKFDAHEVAVRLNEWLPDLQVNFNRARFLHWQVGFPGMWTQWDSVDLHGGFDAVIGNPPYVRQELIKEIKPALKRAYPDTYSGTADLYVYFYEQGLKLLRPGGRMSYVVTNKWMRAGYAEGLRAMFAEKAWIEFVADFGHAKKFFPDADVHPSVLVIRKPEAGLGPTETRVCAVSRDDVPEKDLEEFVTNNTYQLPRRHFSSNNWVLEPPDVVALLEKIRENRSTLVEYCGTGPFNGVKTGFNEAFLITDDQKNRLLSEDPQCARVLKPYLRGQDVKRWVPRHNDLWMICLAPIESPNRPWADHDESQGEAVFKKALPSIYAFFQQFEEQLRSRSSRGKYWWELQSSPTEAALSQATIVYQEIQFHPAYALNEAGVLGNNKTFALRTSDLVLLAILNSPLMWWHNWRYLTHLKDEALSPMGYRMETLPIARASDQVREQSETVVSRIIDLTKSRTGATTSILDWLRLEFELSKPNRLLMSPDALDADAFVSAVRDVLPKKRKLTAAEIGELRREHAATIEPARHARTEVFTLENQLSDLVNKAYGLTPEEVALMWRTAPPRMPFTPAGLASEADEPDEDDGESE